MRRIHRVVMLVTFIAVMPVLAGCADFDPDKLDVFGLNEKKKLPGDRRPLFPEGVPGVSQGIPPEYMKGNQQQQLGGVDTAQTPPAEPAKQTAAAEPAAEPKPKAKPKRQPKPRQATRAPAPSQQAPAPAPAAAQAQQPAPWPEPTQQQQPQQAQSPWPAPAQQSSTAPWPAAPPPGTFSKQ